MEFKSVNKNSKDFVKTFKWKEAVAGQFVVGTYENCDQLDKFGKPIFGFKVIETNIPGYGPGSDLYLNCGGNFKNLMDEVSLEDKVKIVYSGMAKITKGKWSGTMTYDIDVQVAASEEDSDSL